MKKIKKLPNKIYTIINNKIEKKNTKRDGKGRILP